MFVIGATHAPVKCRLKNLKLVNSEGDQVSSRSLDIVWESDRPEAISVLADDANPMEATLTFLKAEADGSAVSVTISATASLKSKGGNPGKVLAIFNAGFVLTSDEPSGSVDGSLEFDDITEEVVVPPVEPPTI